MQGQRVEKPMEVPHVLPPKRSQEQVDEKTAELIVTGIVIPFDGGVFDCAVHPFVLAVGPQVVWLG